MGLLKDFRFLLYNANSLLGRLPSKVEKREYKQRLLQYGFDHGIDAASRRSKMYSPGADTGVMRGDWITSSKSATQMIREDFKNLCARSELAYRTDAVARRAINILTTFVVGQGNKPFPAVKYRNGDPVEGINNQLSADWERFNDQGVRNGTVEMTMYELQALEFATLAVYGSTLTNIVSSRKGSWLPYAFQLLKPHRLDFSKDTFWDSLNTDPENLIVHGMQLNQFAEPQKFFIENKIAPYTYDRMSLSFFPIETEQYLGLPWLTPVLPQIWDHQQLFDDKMRQSRIGARLGVRMPKEDQEGIAKLLDNDTSGNSYFDLDFQGFYFSKGEPKPITITDPISDTFEPLVRMTLSYIAMGLGFSYQLLTSDLKGANFSGARTNTIADSRGFRTLYKRFVKMNLQTKWNKFVEWEVLTGRLLQYGVGVTEYQKDPWYYNQAYWLPMDGEDWVDPLKDQQALVLAYKTGQMTYQELCALTGKNWKSVLRQLQVEKEAFEAAGMEHLIPANIDTSKSSTNANGSNQEKNQNGDMSNE